MDFVNKVSARMFVPFLLFLSLAGPRTVSAAQSGADTGWFAQRDAVVSCIDIGAIGDLGDELASNVVESLSMLPMLGMLAGAGLEDMESLCMVYQASRGEITPRLMVLQGDLDGSFERVRAALELMPVSRPKVKRLANGTHASFDEIDGTRLAFVVLQDRVAVFGEQKAVEAAVRKYRTGARVGFRGSLLGVRVDTLSPLVRAMVGAPSVVLAMEARMSVSKDGQRLVIDTMLRTKGTKDALLLGGLLAQQGAAPVDRSAVSKAGASEGALSASDLKVQVKGKEILVRVELPIQLLAAALGSPIGSVLGGNQIDL